LFEEDVPSFPASLSHKVIQSWSNNNNNRARTLIPTPRKNQIKFLSFRNCAKLKNFDSYRSKTQENNVYIIQNWSGSPCLWQMKESANSRRVLTLKYEYR
jgi:hypothetical protein